MRSLRRTATGTPPSRRPAIPTYTACMLTLCCSLFGGSTATATPTTNSGAAYIAECEAAGVPIAPDWGSDEWIDNGPLSPQFIGQGLQGRVYYYEADNGLCMALPRTNSAGQVTLLGIICQGRNGNACFWDNSTFGLDSITDPKPLSAFTGGAALYNKSGGECTLCHAGENVFIVHPGSALDLTQLGIRMLPTEYASPLVHSNWAQNERPTTEHGACSTCHNQFRAGRLPEISNELSEYCEAVIGQVYSLQTMPPANAPPHSEEEYYSHWVAMLDYCNSSAPPQEPMSSPQYRPGIGWAIVNVIVG